MTSPSAKATYTMLGGFALVAAGAAYPLIATGAVLLFILAVLLFILAVLWFWLRYDVFSDAPDPYDYAGSGAERRAEGTTTAGRSGDHNPTPDATRAAGNKELP